MSSPQQAGRDFEKEFAEAIGAKLVPGSGSQWFAKLDVDGKTVLWSLKYTSRESIKFSRAVIREAIHACLGIGGKGAIPGWAHKVDGEVIVSMRAHDFIGLMQEGIKVTSPTKADVKRARARTPQIMRDVE